MDASYLPGISHTGSILPGLSVRQRRVRDMSMSAGPSAGSCASTSPSLLAASRDSPPASNANQRGLVGSAHRREPGVSFSAELEDLDGLFDVGRPECGRGLRDANSESHPIERRACRDHDQRPGAW